MTRIKWIFLLSVIIGNFACEAPPKSEARKFKVGGLNIILTEIPQSDIVSVGFYQKGGVAYTPEKQAGIEQLLLSVMPKGSEQYDKETLQSLTEAMGTEISGAAGKDYASLSLRCLSQAFEASWPIFEDVILNPVLDSSEIELARVSQLTEIRSQEDTPDAHVSKLAREFYYEGHPYSLSPLGTDKTVSDFSRDDLRNYHSTHFTKSRALLVVVGGVEKKTVLKLAGTLAKALPRGVRYKDRLPEAWTKNSSAMRVIESEMDMPTNYFLGLAEAPDKTSDDYTAFLLCQTKLRTRVFEEVRTKRNLSYAPAAGFNSGKSSTTYLYVTTTQPDTTIKVMFEELDRLKETLLTEGEMKELRTMYLTRHYLSEESVAAQKSDLAANELTGNSYRDAASFMKNIQSVKAEDLQRVARTYLKHYHFTYLGDPEAVNESSFLSYSWPRKKAEK